MDFRRLAGWESVLVGVAVCLALGLGFANLGVPDLWHDELVHVFVAKAILASGVPRLPSGNAYYNASVFNYALAGFMAFLGDSEAGVRVPSVCLSGLNVVLTYLLFRRLLGRPTAMVAAFALALSPWSVAWARQARFYTLQQTLYLAALGCVWLACHTDTRKKAAVWAAAASLGVVLGIGTSYHSALFIVPVGAYAALMALGERRLRSRIVMACGAVCLVGLAAFALTAALMPSADTLAVFTDAGIGGKLVSPQIDPGRADRLLYFHWLARNLGRGYLFAAFLGFGAMILKERGRGVYAALGFLGPVLVLTYLVGYRRERFLFFAYPFYVAAFSYTLVRLAAFVPTARRSWPRMAASVVILLFGARLAASTVWLIRDSCVVASGSYVSLASQMARWREPCLYVRERMQDKTIVSTSHLPALYYVGRCDNWYPSRYLIAEYYEVGHEGLKDVEELKAFLDKHPSGYYLADWRRLAYHPALDEDEAWVEKHMTRVKEASNEDVTVYSWNFGAHDGKRGVGGE